MIRKQEYLFCHEEPKDCIFEMKHYSEGMNINNGNMNINYLIYCKSGNVKISSTLFHDEILCAGEIMFIPRMLECSGQTLSDVTLLVHKFNNTVCHTENCILSYLYSHRHISAKIYCCKLIAPKSIQGLISSVESYIFDGTHDLSIWHLKHKELIWWFTRYFQATELRSFFHPITDEQVPFRNLVLTHYRKANNADELAHLCGYGVYTFRRLFKNEFGISVQQWLISKRVELIKFRLAQPNIPFVDIMDEFDFSSPAHFSNFCKKYIGDTPRNLRKIESE